MLIQVISGTTREGRFSEKVARWVTGHLAAREGFDVERVDLRDYPLPFFDGVAPARAPREYASAEVGRLGRALDRADGFIMLTAEYNHGYPAALKNALDPTPSWSGNTSRWPSSATVTWAVPWGSNSCGWWQSNSRWRRCVTRCTSCPT